MTTYYLDTSALVKGYAYEKGTDWIRDLLLAPNMHTFYTVRLAGPEMIAALFRKARMHELSETVATRLAKDFKVDWKRRYRILEIDARISNYAMALVETHQLRGYDAVHLASALLLHQSRCARHLPALIVLAADEDLLQAAAIEGLSTDNPNHYP
jgi:hypothetical protein